jgi:hypothetical protein
MRGHRLGEMARAQYPVLEAALDNAPSERVRDRARETAARWREAFGTPDETLRSLGRALSDRIREFANTPPDPALHRVPPTRWTHYRPGATPEVVRAAAH